MSGVATAIGGSALLTYHSGKKQREAAQDAQRSAQAAALPYNVATSLGGATFDGKHLSTYRTPEMARIQGRLFSEAEQFGLSPEQRQLAAMQRAGGAQALGLGQGLFGAGQQALGLGQGLFGAGATINPMAIAQQQMGREMALLAPQQQAESNRQQARLFSQGLLGSTAGQGQQQALSAAHQQAQMEAARRSLAGGLDYTGQLFSRGLQGMQLGGQLSRGALGATGAGLGMFGQAEAQRDIARQRQLQALQAGIGIESAVMDTARLGIGAGSGQAAAGIAGANLGLQGSLGAAATQSAFGQSLANSLMGMNFGGTGGGVQPSYYGGGYQPPGGVFSGAGVGVNPALGAEGTGFAFL